MFVEGSASLRHVMTILNSKDDEVSYDFIESEQGHEWTLLAPKLIGVSNVLP
jgi:hypothetical protein